MKNLILLFTLCAISGANLASTNEHSTKVHKSVSDDVIAAQRAELAKNSEGMGFGPQAPRDIDSKMGTNPIIFAAAPPSEVMNLCNIHFHKNAEHKGGEFTTYAGNGDGHGYGSGYKYDGMLTKSESKPLHQEVCPSEHGSLYEVSWSVRPKVAKVNIDSVGQWCKGNVFNEDHAHGVRNLVINPALLSKIQ